MKNRIFIDVPSHLKRSKSKSYKETVIKSYTPLLEFCIENELIKGDFFSNENELLENSIVYESNLTERGLPIFWDLSMKWLGYVDKTQKYNNIKMLEKYLRQLEK